jgi:hypothetical protein
VGGHELEEQWVCVTVSWPGISLFAGVQCEFHLVESRGGLVQPWRSLKLYCGDLNSPSVSLVYPAILEQAEWPPLQILNNSMDHIAPLRSFEGGLGPFQFEVAGRSHDTMSFVIGEVHGHTLTNTSHFWGKHHQQENPGTRPQRTHLIHEVQISSRPSDFL